MYLSFFIDSLFFPVQKPKENKLIVVVPEALEDVSGTPEDHVALLKMTVR